MMVSVMMLAAPVLNAEQWRLHPTYDGSVDRMIDTPDYLYVLSYSQMYVKNGGAAWSDNISRYQSLFRFDKQGEEWETLSRQNMLSENVVQGAGYNRDRKYLAVVYDNGNIDLLYDDGDVRNIPGLKIADSSYTREVNGIVFNPSANEVYLSTQWGFIVVDDSSCEILRTVRLGENIDFAGRCGEKLFVVVDGRLMTGGLNAGKMEDFSPVEGLAGIDRIVDLSEGKLILTGNSGSDGEVWVLEGNGAEIGGRRLFTTTVTGLESMKGGVNVSGSFGNWEIKPDVTWDYHAKDSDNYGLRSTSFDGKNYYIDFGREGICRKELKSDGTFSLAAGCSVPNAPNAFKSTAMVYHPGYGMLVRNHGINSVFTSQAVPTPDLLSGYKGLTWTSLSATYNVGTSEFLQFNPNGVSVDPKNSNHIYSGSFLHGMLRLNLENPDNSLRLGREGDSWNGYGNGFVAVVPDMVSYNDICNFSAPGFDNNGTLWVAWYNHDASEAKRKCAELWYWTADDRLASKDAASYRPLKRMPLSKIDGSSVQTVIPLRSSSHRNILLFSQGGYNGQLGLIDHKGTLDNQSDDETAVSGKFYDQDGTSVPFNFITCFFEDLSTGMVWVGTDRGVFTLRPSEFLKNPERVSRVKVARGDGTNLADYLLDGVPVNCITNDPSGRKWFSTSGGGVVCTSSDGTEVLKTYTTDNSELPDNTVYALCYNPDNNSMMISTDSGLAEMFLSTSAAEGEKNDIVAYPNPVRPDYFGYVTIEGLADNALVKIVDSAGYLIKEIGLAAGGEARWDVTNMNSKRVPSGVYHVLASGGPNQDSFSKVAKILVVN